MRTIVRVVVGAFALWLTTLIVGGSAEHGVWVESYAGDTSAQIATFLLIALVFGIVNGTLGKVVRFISIPLYILTIGLFGLIVNGIMISVIAWLSDLVGFGLRVDGFWWGVLAAIVMSVLAAIMNSVLGTKKANKRNR